jgi:uncharacterized membrane protein
LNAFRFDQPALLWLLLLAVPIVWLGMRSLAALDPFRKWSAIVIRLLLLVLIVGMLAGLQGVQRHDDLTVIAVIDQSESVRRFASPPTDPTQTGNGQKPSVEQWVRDYIRTAAKEKQQDDRFGHVTFDGRATVRSLPGVGVDLDSATIEKPKEGTRAAEALRTSLTLFPPDTGARLLLVSDGNESGNEQELIAAAREAAAAGVPVDVLPINYRLNNEVMVEGVYAPTEAREGQTVAVRVVLRGTKPTPGLLYLQLDERTIDLNPDEAERGMPVRESEWSVAENAPAPGSADGDPPAEAQTDDDDEAGRYVLAKQIDLPLRYSGANKFKALFEPDGGDAITVNNAAESFTLVQGKGRVLVVDGVGGEPGKVLPRALQSHGIELEVAPAHAVPTSLARMSKYDAVILQNVPADQVTAPQQKTISRFVHDMGGGFIMVGGPDSFGAGAWTNTEIDKSILPVECTIPSQTVLPSGALVLVIDRSGSMSSPVMGTTSSQQEIANEAAIQALATLYPDDIVGVVGFDSGAKWVQKPEFNRDPQALAKKVRSITPGGGTDIYSGLDAAYRSLAPLNTQDAAVKHVILLTDGQSAPPPGGGWAKLVGQMMANDITLSTIGVGDGHDGQLLNQLATMGGGQYHPVTNPNTLPQVFIKEAKVVRKNLIKEESFQPRLVSTASPIVQGIDALPTLKGFVLTGPKNDPRVFQPIEGPDGEPIFAHWQVGLGRSAAFTSDATNRWASDWLRWGGYSDFWARTVRAVARPPASRDVDLLTSVQGDELRIRLDAAGFEDDPTGTAGRFADFESVRGAVLAPGGSGEPTPITLEQIGPGVYETSVPATESGNYIVSLFMRDDDGTQRAVFGGASRPPGGELRRFESNPYLLRQIAQETGGRVLDPADPAQAGLYSRGVNRFESRSVRPLWRTLLWILLVLFLLDVANRRIQWEPAAIAGAVKKLGSSMVLKSPSEESAGTLDALKKTRAATQARHDQADRPTPDAPPVDRSRKFDAPQGAVAADSFADAVGGAREDGSSRTLVTAAMRKAKANEGTTDAATTSRLLAAKLRARERMVEEQEEESRK